MLKDLSKVIQQEQDTYQDPITEFLECLFINYDFDGAQKKLHECEDVSSCKFCNNCLTLNTLLLLCWCSVSIF